MTDPIPVLSSATPLNGMIDEDCYYALPVNGPPELIRYFVNVFLDYARAHPDIQFKVARIAPLKPLKDILAMFEGHPSNVELAMGPM